MFLKNILKLPFLAQRELYKQNDIFQSLVLVSSIRLLDEHVDMFLANLRAHVGRL